MGIDKLVPNPEEAEKFSFAETQSASDQTREEEKPLTITKLDSEDAAGIAAYYQFEVDHGFSDLIVFTKERGHLSGRKES